MGLKVKVTVYRDYLLLEALEPEKEHPGWVPAGGSRIGCVLHDTKASLGVSEEALAWLRLVPRSDDGIGDVDWFESGDGKKVFAWLGGPRTMCARSGTGSKAYAVFAEDCTVIPNEVPEGARRAVDRDIGVE